LRANKARNDANIAEEDAKDKARISESRRIAALSESERNNRLDLALLLAVEALRIKYTFEARSALLRALFTRPELRSLLDARGDVWSLAFSPDGQTLASYASSQIKRGVMLWDVGRRARLQDKPLDVAEGNVTSVAFSPDGHTLAAGYGGGGRKGGVVLWDVGRRARLQDEPLDVAKGNVTSVAFSPDGQTLAAGYLAGLEGGVVLWDVERRRPLPDMPLAVVKGNVSSVAFSPDGHTLAAGYGGYGMSAQGGVVLWDAARRVWSAPELLPVPEGSVHSVAFSPDGHTLAAGCSRNVGKKGVIGSVVLWDAARRVWSAPELLPVPEGFVESVAFSPDGHTLAAGYGLSAQGGVVLWDAARRGRLSPERLPLPGAGFVHSVAFSPNSKTLAMGGTWGVVLLDVDLDSWQRLAGQIVSRNLTRAEWQRYFPETRYRPTFDDLPVPPETNTAKPE
jgi:dipeptidyl aminopeptidase/acylaminoacyl peptidase